MERREMLSKAVLREIDREVETVLAQGRAKAEELLEDARLRLQERERQSMQGWAREMERRRTRALARAEMDGRNALLRQREEALEDVIECACARLRAMTASEPERFGELLWTLFTGGRELLAEAQFRVVVGEGAGGVVARMKEAGALEVGQETGWHGLRVESVNGSVRCDYSLTVIMERFRTERAAEIEAILFEAEGEV